MNKKIFFLLFALVSFVIIAGGCDTVGKKTWHAVMQADDWIHRNLW